MSNVQVGDDHSADPIVQEMRQKLAAMEQQHKATEAGAPEPSLYEQRAAAAKERVEKLREQQPTETQVREEQFFADARKPITRERPPPKVLPPKVDEPKVSSEGEDE
jgi:hypothetical protein